MTATIVHLPVGFPEATARQLVLANPTILFVLPPAPEPPTTAPATSSNETISMIASILLTGVAGLITGPAAPWVAIVAKLGASGIQALLTGSVKERHTCEELLALGDAVAEPQT